MVTAGQHVSDFANLFKAFIGSNYLSMPFAFHQSGLALGFGLLAFIALLTDHCCQLIVDCKRLMIGNICEAVEEESRNRRDRRRQRRRQKPDGDRRYCSSDEDEDADAELEMSFATNLHNSVTLGDIAKYTYGAPGHAWVTFALFLTQFGFCINYFIFIGNTLGECFPLRNVSVDVNASEEELANATSIADWRLESTAPSLVALVATPLPVFLAFSLIRNVRSMGGVSVVANLSICFGVVAVLALLLHDFVMSADVVYAKAFTLPVYIGIVAVSYEGIGTIIPIESSMQDNRDNFRAFLRGSLFLVTLILGVIGSVGYMRYGASTKQILVQNLPGGSWFILALDVTLIVGVIFTFPLQVFPVVQMVEHFVFARDSSSNEDEETASLIASQSVQVSEDPHGFLTGVPAGTPTWQRNAVRCGIVLCQLGMAIAMRDYYAYFSAFIGAVGSIFLAYVLPCAAHLRLVWPLPGRTLVKVKDLLICCFGLCASATSLFVTVAQIVSPHFFDRL